MSSTQKDWHPERDWVAPGKIVDGTHFVESGNPDSEQVVCCVHGIGSYHTCFDALAAALASCGFRVIQYDLIGRGFSSSHESERFDAEAHIDQLHRLLTRTLTLRVTASAPVHLVGHSMGGALAALFAAKHAELVRSLVLLSPAGLMNAGPLPLIRSCSCLAALVRRSISSDSSQEAAWRTAFYQKEGVFRDRLEEMVRSQHLQKKYNAGSFEAFWQCALQFPLYGIDREVQALGENERLSVHVVWSREDSMVPFSPCFDRWKKALAAGGKCRVSSTVMEKAGHAFPQEYPEETSADIVKFLRQLDGVVVASPASVATDEL